MDNPLTVTDLTIPQVESKYPTALSAFEYLGRTSFTEEDGDLYAETSNGSRYVWSPTDGEWFDS